MNEEAFKNLTSQFGSLASAVGQLIVAVHGAGQTLHGLEQLVTAPAKAFNDLRGVISTFQRTVSSVNEKYREAIQNVINNLLGLQKSSKTITQLLDEQKKALKDARFEALAGGIGVVIGMFSSLVTGLGNVIGGLLQLGVAALPGGLETFNDVIAYVATVVGSAFAPAIVLVMAGLVTLADALSGPVLAGVDAFLNGGVDQWLQTIEQWISEFVTWTNSFLNGAEKLFQSVWWFVSTIREVGKFLFAYGPALIGAWFGSVFGPLGAAIGAFVGMLLSIIAKLGGSTPDRSKGEVTDAQHRKNLETRAKAENLPPEWVDEQLEREKKEKATKGPQLPRLPNAPDVGKLFDKNKISQGLKDNVGKIVDDMSFNQASKGNLGFTGIADVQKQVQMQAFQSDLAQKRLQVQEAILRELQEKLGKPDSKSTPPMTRK